MYRTVIERSRVDSTELAAAEMARKELDGKKEDFMCDLKL
jgi:hypothetical protein